jgi:hypothetical protein
LWFPFSENTQVGLARDISSDMAAVIETLAYRTTSLVQRERQSDQQTSHNKKHRDAHRGVFIMNNANFS